MIETYAKKFGGPEQAAQILQTVTERAAEAGIEFRMDRALRANTLTPTGCCGSPSNPSRRSRRQSSRSGCWRPTSPMG